ncbi:MAG: hypothetical protein GXP40_08080 [Chloroflexi bacterium]|nr:hypothetical protein [Chloroflexota bacterium]
MMRLKYKLRTLICKPDEYDIPKIPWGYIGRFYFERTGRILGCQSKNHTQCEGGLWTCERCGKRVCWEEGSMDLPEICDDCWVEVKEKGVAWETT